MSSTILRALEYHGRLVSNDGQAVPRGRYTVRFSLHSDQRGQRTSWVETQHDVEIGHDGHVSAVLGLDVPIDPKLFDGRTRWVSARVVDSGQSFEDGSPRTQVAGTGLLLTKLVERHDSRLDTLEENQRTLRSGPAKEKLKQRIDDLSTRLERLEIGEVTRLSRLIDQLLDRMDAVDDDGGRLEKIEDEIEDLCGPDGDIVDVNDRIDDVERRAVRVLEHTEAGPDRYEKVLKRLGRVEKSASGAAEPEPGDAASMGALPLDGGELAGALTIQKGGLAVESGDITGNQVKVFSVTASKSVRAPRIVAEEQLEVRGDITADNTQRAIQIRKIEGRNGSAKKDGPLHLNSRGGHEVVVGNKASAKGLLVHGTVACGLVKTKGKDLAEHFDGAVVAPGFLVRMDGGRNVVLSDQAFDPRVVGIVSTEPGVGLGDGAVPVALRGSAPCHVVGPVRIGDLLVPSDEPGHAMAAGGNSTEGCLVGKAMEDLDEGTGLILVLVV